MQKRMHSREFKREIVLQVATGQKRPAQVCRDWENGFPPYAIFFDGDGILMTLITQNELSTRAGGFISILRSDLPVNFDWLENINF